VIAAIAPAWAPPPGAADQDRRSSTAEVHDNLIAYSASMGTFDRPTVAATPPSPAVDVVREEATRLIAPGFRTRLQAQAEVIELFDDDPEMFEGEAPLAADEIAAIVDDVWSERLLTEQGWSSISDADRLASAFVELEASGVVARMNFSCCGSCGHGEICGEVAHGQSARGYVFFHRQDADGLVEGTAPSLYFDYGAFGDDAQFPDRESYATAAIVIGHEIVHALEAAGLRVEWTGDLGRRIRVVDLDWRRRVPTS
jgi:hypothetical protein